MTSRIEEQRGPFDVVREDGVPMTTRDGVVLRADVYRPSADGAFPALVRRTPYGKRENDLAAEFNEAHYFASHGYIVVVQDVRGRFSSEGEWAPAAEGADTYDAIEWAAQLPGCTGAVGTFGQSYGARLQYAAAALRPPHLRTCIPIAGPFPGMSHNGFVDLAWHLGYAIEMAADTWVREGRAEAYDDLRRQLVADPDQRFSPPKLELLEQLPLTAWEERIGPIAQRLLDAVAVANRPIAAAGLDALFAPYTVPMLHVGSWYDANQWTTTAVYQGLRDHAGSDLARRNQALLMGPWAHLLPYNLPTSGGTGDIDFGPDAAIFLLDAELQWFDHYLKHDGQELPRAPVRIFVMGANRWRDEPAWPLARAEQQTWFLHSGGSANGLGGDGRLSTEPPAGEPPDRYRFDPGDPVPTCGGHALVGGGVYDQRANESRADVLVYTSEPLAQDLELVGPVSVTLHVATSAPDTDVFATLVDVRPDGYAHNLLEGGVRLRHRIPGEISLVEPGAVHEVTLNLWNACHVVRAGHRLRVHVTSSDFPRFDRNANTGAPIGSDAELRTADQTLHHDGDRPSRLVLSVVRGPV